MEPEYRPVSLMPPPAEGVFITSAADAAKALAEYATKEQEHLVCLDLDLRLRPIGAPRVVAIGEIDSVEGGPRDVFREAIRKNAPFLIIAHNHPGDDPEPSKADIGFTNGIHRMGAMLGVNVMDHIVLSKDGFVSIRDKLGKEYGASPWKEDRSKRANNDTLSSGGV